MTKEDGIKKYPWTAVLWDLFQSLSGGDKNTSDIASLTAVVNALTSGQKRAYAEYEMRLVISANTYYPPSYILPYDTQKNNDGSGRIANSGGLFTVKKGFYKVDVSIQADGTSGGATGLGYQTGGSVVTLLNIGGGGTKATSFFFNAAADNAQFFITAANGNITLPVTMPQGRVLITQIA